MLNGRDPPIKEIVAPRNFLRENKTKKREFPPLQQMKQDTQKYTQRNGKRQQEKAIVQKTCSIFLKKVIDKCMFGC